MLYYLVFTLFSALHGYYDGVMYGHFDFSLEIGKGWKHPHRWATLMRLSVLGIIYIATSDWLLILACALAFSFWHNGFYYEGRRKTGYLLYHFFSSSKTSTGWTVKVFGRKWQPLEFGIIQRSILLLLSLIYFFI